MKKLSIYITVLLAASLTACNEDFNEGVASPQSYGQEEAAGKITFTATGVDPINLGDVEEESVAVAVFTAPAVEEEASLSYKMKLDNKVTLSVNSDGHVITKDLQDAVAQIYGIRPVERTMKAVLTAYVASGKTVYAAPAEEFELKVTPEAPVIESAYYINGSLTWEQDVAFGNTSGDPYANPVFITTVPAVITDKAGAQDAYFLIKSNSGKSLGAADADNDALEGNLVLSDRKRTVETGNDRKRFLGRVFRDRTAAVWHGDGTAKGDSCKRKICRRVSKRNQRTGGILCKPGFFYGNVLPWMSLSGRRGGKRDDTGLYYRKTACQGRTSFLWRIYACPGGSPQKRICGSETRALRCRTPLKQIVHCKKRADAP